MLPHKKCLSSQGERNGASVPLLRATILLAFAALALQSCRAGRGEDQSEWRLIGGNNYEQHYSTLDQINDSTVAGLKLAWYADMPATDGLTGIPIVAGGMVYQSGGMGKAWANDLRTGKQIWAFDAGLRWPMGLVPSWGSRISRGLAVWKDKVLKATGDCRLFALDRKTGRKLWEAQACNPDDPKTITGAPRVGGGKVFIGNANGDTGIGRGHVDAFDIETGRRLWRFYTIPGDPAKGFENKAMAMASRTWGKDYWKKSGGGSPWEGITYDPRTDLVLIGTDGPAPISPPARGSNGGDELFTNAIVAVKADTGEYVWHYSTTPGDGWNYAAASPVTLADLAIDGRKREVVMLAPKNGFFYVFDARTGKLVNQPKTLVPVNWTSGIDMTTGRPRISPAAQYWLNGNKGVLMAPGAEGGHTWPPMSYSPKTGLVYVPMMDYRPKMAADAHSAIGAISYDPDFALEHGGTHKGTLVAWDPIRQTARWKHDLGLPMQGGTLATAGNLVFQGRAEGQFAAYDARTGKPLWTFDAGASMLGGASTVQVDGEQFVLIATGSVSANSLYTNGLTGRRPGPARLLAFSLNGKATLPAAQPFSLTFDKPSAPRPPAALAAAGQSVWSSNGCEVCHGLQAKGGFSSVPDLRRSSALPRESFSAIVRGGALAQGGMPVFDKSIREQDVPALQAYILQQAWRAFDLQNKQVAARAGRPALQRD